MVSIAPQLGIIVVSLVCILASANFGNCDGPDLQETPSTSSELANERVAKWATIRQLAASGEILKAIELGERLLELPSNGDKSEPDTHDVLEWLSRLALGANELAKSEHFAELLVKLCESENGAGEWRTVAASWHLDYVKRCSMSPEFLKNSVRLQGKIASSVAAGDYASSADAAKQLIELEETTLGSEHPVLGNSLSDLAGYLLNAKNYAAAEENAEKALQIHSKMLGKNHRFTGLSAWTLAMSRIRQQKWNEATDPLSITAEMWRITNLPEKAGIAESVRGDCLKNQDRIAEATKAWMSALNHFRESGNTKLEAETLLSLVKIGGIDLAAEYKRISAEAETLRAKGSFNAASKLGECKLALEVLTFGEDVELVLQSTEWLASLHEESDGFAIAAKYRKHILDSRIRLHGSKNWETINARFASEYSQQLASLSKSARQRLRDATAQLTESMQVYEKGLFSKAIDCGLQAHQEIREILGDRHPKRIEALSNLGLFYTLNGEYQFAKDSLMEAKSLGVDVYTEEHPNFASILNNIVLLFDATGEFIEAEKFALISIDIAERTIGKKHLYRVCLGNLAALYESMGKYAQAERLYNELLELWDDVETKSNSLQYANTLSNAGILKQLLGKYSQARRLFLQSIEIRAKVDDKSSAYALGLNNLAGLLYEIRDIQQAEEMHLRALEIRRLTLPEWHPEIAQSLNNLGALAKRQGDFVAAERHFSESLQIRERSGADSHLTAQSLDNLGLLYGEGGKHKEAVDCLLKALHIRKQILGPNHPHLSVSLSSLGEHYRLVNNPLLGAKCYLESLQILENCLDESSAILTERQQAEMNMSAKYHLDNYLSLVDESKLDAQAAILAMLKWKAQVLIRQKRLSLSLHDPALKPVVRELQVVASQLSKLMTNDAAIEQELLNSLVERKERLLASLQHNSTDKNSEPLSAKDFQIRLPENIAVLNYFEFNDSEIELVESFAGIGVSLRGDASGVSIARILEGGAAKQDGRLKVGDIVVAVSSETRTWSASTENSLAKVKEILQGEPGSSVTISFIRDGVVNPTSIELTRTEMPLRRSWKSKDTRNLVVTVLRKNKVPILVNLGAAKPIADAINTWRDSYGSSAEGIAAAHAIKSKVWEPLMPALGGADTVLASLDGVLLDFPLSALPGKVEGTYLLEDYRISYVTAPALLPQLIDRQMESRNYSNLVLVGNIDYGFKDDAKSETWKRLPSDESAFKLIKETHAQAFASQSNVVSLAESNADEAKVCDSLKNANVFHIHTHGLFDVKNLVASSASQRNRLAEDSLFRERVGNPETLRVVRSGVVLSHANNIQETDFNRDLTTTDQSYDGLLMSDEIALLPLQECQIAVLSACETGRGEVASGEGVLGIQRAFEVAGAQTTLASLWKVQDQATRVLMTKFYENLWGEKKMTRLDALREAQLWMLNHPNEIPKFGQVQGSEPGAIASRNSDDVTDRVATNLNGKRLSPYYWAAFVMSGDWR